MGSKVVRHVWRDVEYSDMSISASQYPVMGRGFRRVVDLRKRKNVIEKAFNSYIGPLEIKSVVADKIQFWGSSILGAPDGKLALFKGVWHDIDDTDVPFETDFTVTENTVFYVEGTMTLDVDYHTYSMAYAFKSAASAFPEPTPNTTEIIPCWYVPFASGVITKSGIVRWLSVVNVPGIS